MAQATSIGEVLTTHETLKKHSGQQTTRKEHTNPKEENESTLNGDNEGHQAPVGEH